MIEDFIANLKLIFSLSGTIILIAIIALFPAILSLIYANPIWMFGLFVTVPVTIALSMTIIDYFTK